MDNMLIKYETGNEAEGFDLGLLGESFSGTNAVLKELAELTAANAQATYGIISSDARAG